MPDTDHQELIEQLVVEARAGGPASDCVSVLVGVALLAASTSDPLAEAMRAAVTTADRQFVAIAAAHLAGDHGRVDALTRDHLLDHPARPLLTWIVNHSRTTGTNHGGPR
jgi:hypothetical protein